MRDPWRPKPGDRVVRHPREEQVSPVRLTVTPRRTPSSALASPLILVYAFTGLIALGTLLLLLPFTHHVKTVVSEVSDPTQEIILVDARKIQPEAELGDRVDGGFTPFVDALFTATSAATVTGLTTRDTPTYWTRTGHVIILALMYVGGLGFMTIVTFMLVLMGQRVTIPQRLVVKDSYQIDQLGGLAWLTVRVVVVVTAIQIAGFLALAARFLYEYPPAEAIWHAVFQAVSAFNGGGFATLPESSSLSAFQADKAVLGTMGVLILLGAVGYWVLADVARHRRFSLFTLNTKLVLILTLVLTLLGALVFFSSEHDNLASLGPLSVADKAIVSVFEAISGRTAGFSTVDYGETAQHTNSFFILLMFIGGASASVAGGIRVNTLGVTVVGVLSTLRASGHASAFGREIPQAQVQRAVTIIAVGAIFVLLLSLMLAFTESGKGFPFLYLVFDNVSGAGTVGLSTGVTGQMTRWGHLILIISMLVGKTGPSTLSLFMDQRGERDLYRYGQEKVTIG